MLYAAREGHKEIVEALLLAGAEVNKTNDSGMAPLHEAAIGGREDIVKVLLKEDAEVKKRSF